jgi:DNA polymerase
MEFVVHDFEHWRQQARAALRRGERVFFRDAHGAQPSVLLPVETAPAPPSPAARVPRDFMALAEHVACHRDPRRWNLLYDVLWRLTHGEPKLLEDHGDKTIRELREMEKAVRRDLHKMRAFVRFRKLPDDTYVAWYKPSHRIVRRNASFFVRRFGAMSWAILTPDDCAYWDTRELRFGPGLPREAAPAEDQVEDLWLTYYSSIFNPARANLTAMRAEMPAKHWDTLPEARLIGNLLRDAPSQVAAMNREQPDSAKAYIPANATLHQLAHAIHRCAGCELYLHATQAVFGEGPARARILVVGEQPGDQEDLAGRPFVGPAGQLLDRALAAAGVPRDELYVTNAVKHFRFEEQSGRRLHKKPKGSQLSACRPWLEAEIDLVKPEIILCLGATAAQTVVGREVSIHKERGRWLPTNWPSRLLITIHPSALLRMQALSREPEYQRFVADLRLLREDQPPAVTFTN